MLQFFCYVAHQNYFNLPDILEPLFYTIMPYLKSIETVSKNSDRFKKQGQTVFPGGVSKKTPHFISFLPGTSVDWEISLQLSSAGPTNKVPPGWYFIPAGSNIWHSNRYAKNNIIFSLEKCTSKELIQTFNSKLTIHSADKYFLQQCWQQPLREC